MHIHNDPEPPRDMQEFDILMRKIEKGEDSFAALSDEQRGQLKCELADAWIAKYMEDYPVPVDVKQAAAEYRAIQSGVRYPYVPEHVRTDLLIQFDLLHAEGGGPDHWTVQADQSRRIPG
jgi:hypothetical protein